jgi:hypothetical protein
MSVLLTTILLASLPAISCPKYLPNTNVVLDEDVYLTHEQNVSNLMRCYCEVVMSKERVCRENHDQPAECRERTNLWIRNNILSLMLARQYLTLPPVPVRNTRIISIDP